jgi:phage gp36-like protein
MYADPAALRARFDRPSNPELTQLTGGPGADGPDLARLAQALTEASGEMDDAFRARYAVPLSGYGPATAERLAQVCCDIARYRLWADAASEEVVRRYEQAYAWLRDVARGLMLLDASARDAAGAAGAPACTAPAPTFSPDTLTDY